MVQPIDLSNPEFEALTEVLEKMWELSNKQFITTEEAKYFNKHLHIIQNYYTENAKYWDSRRLIQYGDTWVRETK